MSETEEYILNEIKMIEKECLDKGISPSEWVARYAEKYRRKRINGNLQKAGSLKREEGL